MLRRLRIADARGDTIIEVLVVLAVLGLAISISYATANSSLMAARQAQESAQATQILQSQIESLTFLAPNGPPPAANSIFRAGQFCISGSTTVVPAPNAACVQGGRYTIAITYGGAATNDTFTLTAVWDDVAGQGQDKAKMVYRVHPS